MNVRRCEPVLTEVFPASLPAQWVTANFKESQIGRMAPGEAVEISVDAYPDKVFKGHVDSNQAGTGA